MSSSSSSSSSPNLLFVIVGRSEPLYEAEFNKRTSSSSSGTGGTPSGGSSSSSDAVTRQNYFVLHSALDLVEKAAWTTSHMYLKVVDKVNHQMVSTFVTAGNVKFLLLHTGGPKTSEDAVRNFFQDVYELYVKYSMNPFYRYDTPIRSAAFDTRVRAIARRYL